jgi:hypothetical protein
MKALSTLTRWIRRVIRTAGQATSFDDPAPAHPIRRAWWRPAVMNLGDESRAADAAEADAIARYGHSDLPLLRQRRRHRDK